MASTQKTFALILGIVLLLVGILGFFNLSLVGDEGYFGTNTVHDVLHIIAGVFGIYVGTKGKGPGYNASLGWIGIVLFVLGIIPQTGKLLMDYLKVNMQITILHLVLGVLFLLVYYTASKK
ncbi:MAG: DUF4383 domain-containing protein [Nanoarchaeota archaeon]|nr:DUF4383 domain-containing protein [Nanoarchaeota archaeon]